MGSAGEYCHNKHTSTARRWQAIYAATIDAIDARQCQPSTRRFERPSLAFTRWQYDGVFGVFSQRKDEIPNHAYRRPLWSVSPSMAGLGDSPGFDRQAAPPVDGQVGQHPADQARELEAVPAARAGDDHVRPARQEVDLKLIVRARRCRDRPRWNRSARRPGRGGGLARSGGRSICSPLRSSDLRYRDRIRDRRAARPSRPSPETRACRKTNPPAPAPLKMKTGKRPMPNGEWSVGTEVEHLLAGRGESVREVKARAA